MKRLLPILLLVAAFALGAGVATKLQTYPYVPDALNEPCGKTRFEWDVMAARIDTTPVPLRNTGWDIIKLEGEPKKEGLIVRAYLKPRDPKEPVPDTQHWQSFVGGITGDAASVARRRFGLPDGPQGPPNLYLLVHIGNRLVSVWRAGQMVALSPDATRQERLAAMAQVMSRPSAERP